MPYAIFDRLIYSSADVEGLVVRELGPRYRLGGVVDLQQLGLKEWPFTAVGKLSVISLRHDLINLIAMEKFQI
jgi:hypothetical protein